MQVLLQIAELSSIVLEDSRVPARDFMSNTRMPGYK